jgi:hypothetical protein
MSDILISDYDQCPTELSCNLIHIFQWRVLRFETKKVLDAWKEGKGRVNSCKLISEKRSSLTD